MKSISFVLPVYNEQESITKFYEALKPVIDNLSQAHKVEVVFVNDGSRDNSLEMLLGLREKDSRLTVLNFARNFGHQAAITAGLRHTSADAIIMMDSDLQDPPSLALEMIQKWNEGFEVVYAERRSRKDSLLKKVAIYFYYRIFNRFSDIQIPKDTGDFRLLGRRPAEVLKSLPEQNPYLRGLSSFVGFKQTNVLYDRDGRVYGVTKYPLRKLIKLASDGMFSFSKLPLHLATYFGLMCVSVSIVWVLILLYLHFVSKAVLSLWPFVGAASLWFFGTQALLLGILGNYIGRIYDDVRSRPLYIVADVFPSRQEK